MSTYTRIGDLPLRVDAYRLDRLELNVSSGFRRVTTLVRLEGSGHEGVGEDVTYDAADHDLVQQRGAVHDLAGSFVLAEFAERLDGLELFPRRPMMPASRYYRRWAFESAALDLALRQAGRPLAAVLDREPGPVRFVVSLRLGEPPTTEPLRKLLERYPGTRFKLDPTTDWDDLLVEELASLACVDSVDLKGHYRGTPVDQEIDLDLYRRVVEGFPGALLEDPSLTPETEALLRPHRDRITWDAPLHSVADIQSLPFEPAMINVKPSRFGTLETLCEVYDHCAARGIGAYGGGQFELGPGRAQLQVLASLFHPDAPNDVAPGGYNVADPPDGLPASPLPPPSPRAGFRLSCR